MTQIFVTLWTKWIAEIQKIIPSTSDYFNLEEGVSLETIKAEENCLGIQIPPDLKEFYSIHDVIYNPVTSVFCFRINDSNYHLIPFENIANEHEGIDDLNSDDNIKIGYHGVLLPNSIKVTNYANPKWIPFAEGRNGDYLLIDCDPAENGIFGQIIELQNESWERIVVANSMQELIEMQIEKLQAKDYTCYDFILNKIPKKSNAIAKSKKYIKPFEILLYEGVRFRVIDIHEAHEIIGDLTDFCNNKIYDVYDDSWRFPIEEENAFFLLAEDDVEIEKLDLAYSTSEYPDIFILGFIFKRNLKAKKYIMACDTDNSPTMIVLGKLETVNLFLFGNVFYIDKDVQCDAIIGQYNHGELFVKGATVAWLILADDMYLHFEKFTGIGAIINSCRPDVKLNTVLQQGDETIFIENYFPSTAQISDIVVDGYWQIDEYGNQTLANNYFEDIIEIGYSLIDHDKLAFFEHENFDERLLEKVHKILELNEIKTQKSIEIITEFEENSFSVFDYNESNFYQISYTILNGFNIRMRLVAKISDFSDHILLLEYLNEDLTVNFEWQGNTSQNNLEMKAVKNGVLQVCSLILNNN
jgi:cell wall assembly regulator SMI1